MRLMRRDVGEAWNFYLQLRGAAAAPKEMRVRGSKVVEEVLTPSELMSALRKFCGENWGSSLEAWCFLITARKNLLLVLKWIGQRGTWTLLRAGRLLCKPYLFAS
jgi:hypothetical protein